MPRKSPHREITIRARSLRKAQTTSEGLLWAVLRAKQLCGLKFRRQYPIEPWIVDFACLEQRLVVEIDGSYHNDIVEDDLDRQKRLEALGWNVIRFPDKDVEEDAEAVARAIARWKAKSASTAPSPTFFAHITSTFLMPVAPITRV